MRNSRRLFGFMVLLAVAAVLTPVRASGSCVGATCPLSGNVRFQYGNFVPIPITFAPVPNGKVAAVASATVMAGTSSVPSLMLAPGQLFAPAQTPPLVLPLFANTSALFQTRTAISASFPRVQAAFGAGGRTGPAIATFCPGLNTATLLLTGCLPGTATIPGRMRYVKTANQFGGPAQFRFGGSASVALRAASGAPCSGPGCLAIFARNTPPPTLAAGGPFGFVNAISRPAPNPGLFFATVTPGGLIVGMTSPGIGTGLPNPITSFGGPWTTGMITISQTGAFGGYEVFMLTGSDGRISGVGNVSLVAGSLTERTLYGPNANPAWLNLNVPEPSLLAMVGAGAALLALAGRQRMGRRRPR